MLAVNRGQPAAADAGAVTDDRFLLAAKCQSCAAHRGDRQTALPAVRFDAQVSKVGLTIRVEPAGRHEPRAACLYSPVNGLGKRRQRELFRVS